MTPRARATGGAAPPTLLLGLENSNAGAAGRARQPLTRVTLFAPFWLDNRTGRPLTFQDRAAAPGSLCLPHGRALGAFAEVQCPGAGARRRAVRAGALSLRPDCLGTLRWAPHSKGGLRCHWHEALRVCLDRCGVQASQAPVQAAA